MHLAHPLRAAVAALAVALATSSGCAVESTAAKAAVHSTAKPSLYSRLGGAYAIAAVVDDFVDRLLVDRVVTGNAAVVAHLPAAHIAGLKFQVTALVCEATGGPEKYAGKSMRDAHQGMRISAAEWDAMARVFQTTLDQFGVPAAEQGELLAIVGTTRSDIVEEATSGA